jgi:magnesium chelatase subunit I
MNPEEGKLRPQILDRFGLRVIVRGLKNNMDRLEAYHRVQAYTTNPRFVTTAYGDELVSATKEIQTARMKLAGVTISDRVAKSAIKLIQQMGIDSLRAEITWFEAARAYAAADGRKTVRSSDLRAVAPMALRLRRSEFMTSFFELQDKEEKEMERLIKSIRN